MRPEPSTDSLFDAVLFDLDGVVTRAPSACGCAGSGASAVPDALRWVVRLRDGGVRIAVVSASANGRDALHAAGIDGLFDAALDGRDLDRLGLCGKPSPDGFLRAAARLRVDPRRAVVVEDAPAGVAAGRAGGFGLVIGVARGAGRTELRAAGADVVVGDLGELVR